MTGRATGELDRQATGMADVLIAALAFSVAFALRSLSWPAVFTENGVRLVGADAHYHLRRIQWCVENFPDVLTFDPYVNFPHGGEPIWTPLFDGVVAALALVARQSGDPTGVETLASWVPPVLGAATVAATCLAARAAFGRRVGVIAAATLCAMPAHVHYSQVGYVDHHAAVALVTTLLLWALLRCDWRLVSAFALGSSAAACLLVWPGALLHVAAAQAILLAGVVTSEQRETARRRAAHAAVTHGVAFLWVAPFAIGRSWTVWGDLSPLVLSSFQPLWLGLPALSFGACALLWRPGVGGNSLHARRLTAAAALAAPFLLVMSIPSAREGVADAVAWLFRTESFQAVVSESLPLFSDGSEWTTHRAERALTPLVYALPVMLVVLWLSPVRRARHRTLAAWSALLFAATFAQYRFSNSFSVAWAITIACTGDIAWRAVRTRGIVASRAVLLAACVVAGLLLAPIARSHAQAWGRAQRAWRGEAVRAPEIVTHHESLVAAASWLREHSPPTAGWLEPTGKPRYGVLTAWGDGHVVRYVAQRPVIQDNFGDDVGRENFADAERYFAATNEATALGIAARLRIRYVLVRNAGSGHAPHPYASRSMAVRMNRLRGSAGNLRAGEHPDGPTFAPSLVRHRLVYESPPRGEQDGRFKLYEVVKGARVVGDASRGALVEARLELRAPAEGMRFQYRTHARANDEGRYRLRLPYPTAPFEGRFAATGPYAIESEGVVATLRVEETAVRGGARVEGPSLVR